MDEPTIRRLSPQHAYMLMQGGQNVVLLDVREDFERDIARIPAPASVRESHIPMGQIPAFVEGLADELAGGELIVYCHHGQRSMVVATYLARRGVANVSNLEGGIDAWSQEIDAKVPRY